MNYCYDVDKIYESRLHGRYIRLSDIEPLIIGNQIAHREIIGTSVLGRPLYSLTIGNGPTRILMWSQMHGNETTATKAIFDFLNLMASDSPLSNFIHKQTTICIIPMLNPDGGEVYTRENANGIDINRDFADLSQPESRALRSVVDSFKPSLCLNLHDQRTIFGVGDTGRPATISLLAPAYNAECEFNDVRLHAVDIIMRINEALQKLVPGMVGRFDDSFNRNCAGDSFQHLGFPTVLIEAGHFPNDYQREIVRRYFLLALVSAIKSKCDNDIVTNGITEYMRIPQNKANYYDIVYRNAKISYDGIEKITNFAVQYREELSEDRIQFNGYIAEIGNLSGFFAHKEIDAEGELFSNSTGNCPIVGEPAFFSLGNTRIDNRLF